MYPLFKEGDIIVVNNRVPEFKKGDIVVFKPNLDSYKYIIHRIVKIKKDKIVTRGDNIVRADQPSIDIRLVVGKADYLVRNSNRKNIMNGMFGSMLHKIFRLRKILDLIKRVN